MWCCVNYSSFWTNPNCPTKFKLIIFDAVIRSKLVYGLDSLQINEGTLKHLNAFQLKGLRKILGLKTTYVERANSNKVVFSKANALKNPKKVPGKDIKPFSSYIQSQQNKLLAHIIRAEKDDPLRQTTLSEGTHYPYKIEKRRVGRPRNDWTWSTYERILQINIPTPKDLWKADPYAYMDMLKPAILNRTIKILQ